MKKALFIISLLLLASCNYINNDSKEVTTVTSNSVDTSIIFNNGEDILAPDSVYDDLFNPINKVEIELIMNKDQLIAINNDYLQYKQMNSKSPIYRMGNIKITINDKSYYYHEVGIRMKGNTSRRSFLDENNEIDDLIHYKLSFSETFDKASYYGDKAKVWEDAIKKDERKNRKFASLDKIDLKWNKNFDATYSKEYFAYKSLNDFNVIASNFSLAKVSLTTNNKQESLGIYTMIEPIDTVFINRRFPIEEQGGDLYKVQWGTCGGGNLTSSSSNCMGVEDEDKVYFPTYDLKTNKKTSKHESLKNLIDTLNRESVEQLESTLDQLVDMESFLRLEALSYFLGNPDDMRNNDNNYYIYFLKQSGKAYFMFYDCDRVLGINKDWNPSGSGMMYVEPFTKKRAANNQNTNNPLYLKTFVTGGSDKWQTQYKDYLLELINNDYFSIDKFNNIHKQFKVNYQNDYQPTISKISWMGVSFSLNENPTNQVDGTDKNINYSYYISQKMAFARTKIA